MKLTRAILLDGIYMHPDSHEVRPARNLAAILLIGLLCAGTATGQEYAGNPYTAFHSMETFEKENESLQAVRLPIYITLRSWENRTLGLRLRLAGTFALTDLYELQKADLDQIKVLSFVPGMEFVFPVGTYHMLRPYLDVGFGSTDVNSDKALLGAVGIRTELLFPHGKNIFGLEPGLQVSGNDAEKFRDDVIFNPFITLTARRVLGFRVSGYLPDLGVYGEGGYNFATFELSSLTTNQDDISTNYEVGVDFGFSHGRPHIGPFPIPRIRVGYRFGDIKGFRIRIGGDWLRTIPEDRLHEPLPDTGQYQ